MIKAQFIVIVQRENKGTERFPCFSKYAAKKMKKHFEQVEDIENVTIEFLSEQALS